MSDNISILDQIISNQKAEEVANLDAVEIINNLFSELSEREKDVIIRRYGLHGEGKETLENIGGAHKLTRERIRQIETNSIKKLQKLDKLGEYIKTLKKIILQLLEEHGGLVEREYMLDLLVKFSLDDIKTQAEDEIIHKNYLNFLITKLLFNEFEEISSSKHFKNSYKLKHQSLDHLEEIIEELIEAIDKVSDVLTTEEMINLVKNLESYKKHESKLTVEGVIDISRALNPEYYEENNEIINKHKPLFSLFKAISKVDQNKFGNWGNHKWRTVKPKTINDKIYLVLNDNGKPMHFAEIADRINKVEFDKKKANAATVHNELILDEKYVLIGRGIYGLKEWGYKEGTVVEVIESILKEIEESLSKEEIIEKVLEKRMVKKATIILALMNKDKFNKSEGKYTLVK